MPASRSNGFTLVEMVVSLVLLSLISVIGYQGIAYSSAHWQKGHDSMLFQYDHHQAVSWIRNRSGTAEKVRSRTSSDSAYFFHGDSESLEFVTRYTRTRQGGLYVNRISFDQAAGNIVVDYRLYHPDVRPSSAEKPSDRVKLLSNVNSIELSYYGRDKLGKADWYESWTNNSSLPRLIRLDIVDRDGRSYQSIIHVATSNNV